MEKVSKFIVKIRYILFGLFIALTIAMGVCFFYVKTNYDMTKYLDESSPSRIALKEMEETFGPITVADIVFTSRDDLSKSKEEIEKINGIVLALHEDNSAYIKGSNYLLKVFISEGIYSDKTAQVIDEISELLSDTTYYMTSTSVSYTFLQHAVNRDMVYIATIAVAVLLIILFITCSSWIDPLILLITLVVGIIINLGSNIILGEISFVTRAICIVMQFALSMDFSVVFLHRYKEERLKCNSKTNALTRALKSTVIPVGIAGLTTIVGLIALTFMDFRLGFDIGIVLSKGVIISLLTTFLFMPALLLIFDKLILKTKKKTRKKKEEKDTLGKLTKFQIATRILFPILLVFLSVGGALLSMNTEYSYLTTTSKNPDSRIVRDANYIQESFGYSNNFVIVMEENDIKEQEMIDYLISYRFDGSLVFNNVQSAVARKIDEPMNVAGMLFYAEEYFDFKARFMNVINSVDIGILTDEQKGVLADAALEAMISYVYEEAGVGTTGQMAPIQVLEFLSTREGENGYVENMINQIKDIVDEVIVIQFIRDPILELIDQNFDGGEIQRNIDEYYFLATTARSLLKSDGMTRILCNMNMPLAGDDTFMVVRNLRVELQNINPDIAILSEAGIMADIQEVFTRNITMVNVITILGIFVCVLLAFRNPFFPMILVFLLQGSSWISGAIINLAFPPMFFITHIMVLCIMMGACDDYAIVFADYYKEEREKSDKKKALRYAFQKSIIPILTSGSILIFSALIVAFATEVQIISDIGIMLALECSIAIGLIIFVLPQIVYLFDKLLLWDPIVSLKNSIKKRKMKNEVQNEDNK